MTWTTKTQYVDLSTGELITKNHVDKKLYVKIKHAIRHEKTSAYYGVRHITWECEPNRQKSIEF